MTETLPLREARAVPSWFAAPLVAPPGVALPESGRPRIYIVPLESRIDGWIARASLARAGLPPPRWVPGGSISEERVREDFFGGLPVMVPLTAPTRGPDRLARLLAWAHRAATDIDLVPVETLWGPEDRAPSLRSVLLGGANDPPLWRRLLGSRLPGVRVAVGAPGTLSRLAAEAPRSEHALDLSAYVRRQAVKALSIAERHVFGDWYKVPRLVVEQILAEPDFQDRVAAAGAALGLRREEALRSAARALRELATRHNVAYVELLRRFVRWLYTRVYEPEIAVDAGQLERLRGLSRRAPLVFVPSHKSNFDHLILYYTLLSSGFPPPHTAAGINMSFFPMSRILPGTGAYFIRRTFQDDPVYKECLRGFVGYLVERRFHQEFFVEGGRSRTGKLLPPRYGMLHYVVDGARRCNADDVLFVPTAIAYDEVAEVGEYVREQLGEDKKVESAAFLVRLIWSLRRRRLGRVYVRFAEPISLARWLDRAGEDRLVVEKLAFQIAHAINEVTPLTAVAAVCSVFLGAGRRALTAAELEHDTERLIDYAGERGIPIAPELERGAKVAVGAATRALRRSGVVSAYDEGIEPVYAVADEQRHVASFYRNTTVHFFLVRAIASLAREAARRSGSVEGWALRLRDLTKFEFFFPERDAFLREVEREAQALAREEQAGAPAMGAAGPRLVLDYLEGYWVAMCTLETLPARGAPISRTELARRCIAVGRQLLLQGRVAAPELLTSVNFRNALQLAENQGAVRAGPDGYVVADLVALRALEKDLDTLAAAARR
jgi:glycerol-3-phosphate O-acyltransferase